MSDEGAPQVDPWRKEGRCSACTFFVVDFGADPVFYGHCKIYRRTGSRSSADAACGEFRPLPGFEETVRLIDKSPMAAHVAAPVGRAERDERARGGAGALRNRRSPKAAEARIVRRRSAEDGRPLSHGRVVVRDSSPVDDDVLAALFGEESPEGGGMDRETLRDVLLELIEDHIAIEDVELAPKWAGGSMTLQPGNAELKPYELDLETFFKKIIMLRDRLRVLEAKINGHEVLSSAEKVDLQQYISRCYGSLTSFNVLFRHGEDRFSSK